MKKIFALSLCATLMLSTAGCSLYRNDRCYVEDNEYNVARNYFLETNSLDIVQRILKDAQWKRCKINESIYRLEKEFEVVE